ncbi:LysR substrate-binding domain-containing protein [Breoghania sp.]|uniref:LysR substrate-binding domain-containing protein n=1 Tax=Breoghania sp. TaxID=2065378 RepID=UPI002630AEE0|nr:LysR substrate-binding domain-containing protein [Breoghania sp.]MDJ0932235.1 LysR substrate-binding domain-containing protein [Breoghania sp.]
MIVDAIFPKDRLFAALARFAELHPYVEVHLLETVRQTMVDVRADDFDLAVLMAEPGAKWSEPIAEMSLVAMASTEHPLLCDGRAPGDAALAHHTRAEIRGMEGAQTEHGGEGRIWRMNMVETAIEAVRRALCYS